MNEDLTDMLRNDPLDVVCNAFSQAFLQGAIFMFQRDNEVRSLILTNADAHDKAMQHYLRGRCGRQERQRISNDGRSGLLASQTKGTVRWATHALNAP